jgi:hypothetical protein
MTRKGVLECRQQCDALFAQGRQVAADATKHGPPLLSAKTPGDLLLHFNHTQIALGLVVIKGHRKIEQEAQHRPLASREAIQQIARWALFGSPRCPLPVFRLPRCRGRRVGLVAFGEERIIATQETCQHQGIQCVLSQCFGSLHLGFHREQQVFHLTRPRLLEFFLHKSQLAQVMDIAPGLSEGVALIAQESIMDTGATKLWRNANGIERLAPSARMRGVVGESICRADMDSPPRFANAQSCFILVDHSRVHERRFQLSIHSRQLLVAAFDKAGDASR